MAELKITRIINISKGIVEIDDDTIVSEADKIIARRIGHYDSTVYDENID
jgi:hypothetical protein